MPEGSAGLTQRMAPWLLAVTLAVALWMAYRNAPPEELFGGVVRHDLIPACKTNPIQLFDAATPTVSPDLCWAHGGDRVIWMFPNNSARVFHVRMAPHPFTVNPGSAFQGDSLRGVLVSDPVRPHTDIVIYKYIITFDGVGGGTKKVEAQVLLMK